ncbi:MAG: 3'-5'-exoribonuclease [Peltula sp. TS41687]|nr:MAG: 3'-5'-exoribonuclease [Peltula sp. TS41687]
MTDRRRINGPLGGTAPPVFSSFDEDVDSLARSRPRRTRGEDGLRKIFLKTGLTPSASGSAYLELQPSIAPELQKRHLVPVASAPKLTCVVHGPRPLPRSAPFTPHILLSTHVKYAPFATRHRRGYIRDSTERDLAIHLETALRGVIIGDRWPKSAVEVVITILEGEEDRWYRDEAQGGTTGIGVGGWGMMSLLAGCITVASAAIADAGIDCVDLVCGGVAALMDVEPDSKGKGRQDDADYTKPRLLLDPSPSEHTDIRALCVIGYMSSRDEITEIWVKGDIPENDSFPGKSSTRSTSPLESLMDGAVKAAVGVRSVLGEAVKEAGELKLRYQKPAESDKVIESSDTAGVGVEMKD